jgi:protein-disulfide isomerase
VSQDRDHNSFFVSPSTQDHIRGVLDASVALVMCGDYQCTRSGDVYRLIKTIQQQLAVSLGESHMCFIFRHFPQIDIHPRAQRAAEAAEAAAAQGKFWQMHDILCDRPYALEDADLLEYGNMIGLDISQLLREMSRRNYRDRISEHIESGLRSGVTHTPTLFINGNRYNDTWKRETMLTAINEAGNLK